MIGAVSQVDTFDYKPMLEKMHGQELPPSVRGKGPALHYERRSIVLPAGEADAAVSSNTARAALGSASLFPYTAKIVDDLCFIKTLRTDHVNHDPAAKFMHTGFQLAGRPPEGAWVNYAHRFGKSEPAGLRRVHFGHI